MPQPVPGGQPLQGGGEEPGGEGVAGADRGHDVGVQGGGEGDRVAVEEGGAPGPLLHDQGPGFGQRCTESGRASGDLPRRFGLVLTDEHDVGAAREVEQDVRSRGVAPQPRAVVDVEGDQRAAGPARGELAHQGEAVVGERGGDPGQMQYASRADGVQVHVLHRHRGGGRSGTVVRDLVGVGRPVARRAEVDARRTRRVPSYGGGVDAVRGDRLDEVVAEPVGADPADPPRGVPGRGEHARHVRLRPADPPLERRHVGEAPRAGRQERDHGLAERDDIKRADIDKVGVTMAGAPRSWGQRHR